MGLNWTEEPGVRLWVAGDRYFSNSPRDCVFPRGGALPFCIAASARRAGPSSLSAGHLFRTMVAPPFPAGSRAWRLGPRATATTAPWWRSAAPRHPFALVDGYVMYYRPVYRTTPNPWAYIPSAARIERWPQRGGSDPISRSSLPRGEVDGAKCSEVLPVSACRAVLRGRTSPPRFKKKKKPYVVTKPVPDGHGWPQVARSYGRISGAPRSSILRALGFWMRDLLHGHAAIPANARKNTCRRVRRSI